MSKTNSFEESILRLIFQNTAIQNGGGTDLIRGGTTAGNLRIALYTAQPNGDGEVGSGMSSNEANYTGYSRILAPRNGATWSLPAGSSTVTNAAKFTFPACTGGSNVITHFAILTDSGLAHPDIDANMWFYGSLTQSLSVSNGITPEFNIGALTITEQ